MNLTKQQRQAVLYHDSAFIEACPGSGKTRTLAAKLLHLLDEVRETPRKISCITYTNAAAHEIENRLRLYEQNGDDASYEVSTIHSFCLTNVLSPYYWKLPNLNAGYEILPSDSDKYEEIVRSICHRHNLQFNLDTKRAFEGLGRNTDGSPIALYPLDSKPDVALGFWSELERQGLIDFTNIIYYSYLLIASHSSIAKSLACKFSWILIDEFQDTTALQFEVLKKIAGFKITKFFLVGDPKQSIYGFAGADPALMYKFSNIIRAKSDFVINKNWRSSQRIIECAEKLLPRSLPMAAVGVQRDFQFRPFHCHCESPYDGIFYHFLPLLQEHGVSYGNAAILAPWWITLYQLGRKLSQDGIPIVGPGARPYRRSKYLFARFAERICEYIETSETHLIPLLERELFFLVRDLTGQVNFRIFSYWGRRIVIQLVKEMSHGTDLEDPAEAWLKSSTDSMREILETEQLIQGDHGNILSESVNDLIKEICERSDFQLRVRDMAIFSSYSNNMKLLTFHGAKGLEFDAVALIDVHEGRIPHFSIKHKSSGEQQQMIEESKRLFYVGITRARKILMYFTDDCDKRNSPSRLLNLV